MPPSETIPIRCTLDPFSFDDLIDTNTESKKKEENKNGRNYSNGKRIICCFH
jgi:hypothetical protein